MKALFSLLAVLLASVSFAQEYTVSIAPYTSLVVSRGVDVRLVKSNSNDIKISVNGIDREDLIIDNSGDELEIKVATKSLWQEMQDKHWWARLEVPYRDLEYIEVMSGAKVSSDEIIGAEDLEVDVSIGGELEIKADLGELIVDASMGGLVEIAGNAVSIDLAASMGAEVDLRELIAKDVYAKSTMGSEVRVHATEKFDGRANMGGYIRVSGNPDKIYEHTSMGGDIITNR